MCVCNGEGFWACDESGSCGQGHMLHEQISRESGYADDDHSSDPTPTSYENSGDGYEGEWFCTNCGCEATPHWATTYEACCHEAGLDENGEQLDPDELVESTIDKAREAKVVTLRRDDNVNHERLLGLLRSPDQRGWGDDFPMEARVLFKRRSIRTLEVSGERAAEVLEDLCAFDEYEHNIQLEEAA